MKEKYFDNWRRSMIFLAGAGNLWAIASFGLTIAHHTGNMTLIAFLLVDHKSNLLPFILLNVSLFVVGGIISGSFFYDRVGNIKKQYLYLTLGFGVLLGLIRVVFVNPLYVLGFWALGMGVFNGIHIKQNDLIIRLTHVTGYLTDLGVNLARVYRRDDLAKKRLSIASEMLLCFFLGALCSALLYQIFAGNIIYLIALLYIGLGLIFVLNYKIDNIKTLQQ
ncbi:MAG: YoaK family protein [Erysipelotrichaceae bacterium]|nr:YoaK family protein [Erysipelotrichaceae bacterium]